MTSILLINALVLLVSIFLLWLLSVKLKDVSIVDIFWGLGFVLVTWVSVALTKGFAPRRWLLCTLVTVWGVRLAVHLWLRNHGKGEDYRYQSIRKRVGPSFWWSSLFIVFGFQGVLIWLISLPLQVAQADARPFELTWLDYLGLLVWIIGFAFEALGDDQLKRFKANPQNKGKVMDQGLWRYTRHPNYFGDALLWWGLWLIAVSTPYGLMTIFSPFLMTLLLLKISGVSLLEKTLTKSKPGYESYIRRTNAFIPWFPKK
jgi:steroid 5-alpha reductase family enzyme